MGSMFEHEMRRNNATKSRTSPLCLLFVAAAHLSLRERCAVAFSPTPHAPTHKSPTALDGAVGGGTDDRRTALRSILRYAAGGTTVVSFLPPTTPDAATAANLPRSTGADLTKTGTIESLIPIATVRRSFLDVKTDLSAFPSSSPATRDAILSLSETLKSVPTDENKFKRIFDEYSDPVSYKQKFMDSNAFLVYYTKGFDGPGRPSMESGDANPKQTRQYGARNDAWAAYDDLLAELKFARSGGGGGGEGTTVVGDLLDPLDRVLVALDEYLSFVDVDDVQEATNRMMRR